MPAFSIDDTSAMILAYPNNQIRLELTAWLHGLGIPFDRFVTNKEQCPDLASAYNLIVHLALHHTESKYFIFADNDVGPNKHQTDPFLELPGDVVSCEYDGEPERIGQTWGAVNAFHAGLWRASRAVLQSIRPPWFEWRYVSDGTAVKSCLCPSFSRKALQAGFTIRHGGWCDHKPKCNGKVEHPPTGQ